MTNGFFGGWVVVSFLGESDTYSTHCFEAFIVGGRVCIVHFFFMHFIINTVTIA